MSEKIWSNTEFRGANLGVLLKIKTGIMSPFWSFEQLDKDSKAEVKKPDSSSSSSSDDTAFECRDGVVYSYPKETLKLDPQTGEKLSSSGSSSSGTGLATVTFATNFAPIEFTNPAEFQQSIVDAQAADDIGLVILAGGYTGESAATFTPATWLACLVKMSGTVTLNPGTAFSFAFDSFKADSTITAASLTGATVPGLTIHRGGTGKDVTGVKPPAITEAQAAALLLGKPVILNGLPAQQGS